MYSTILSHRASLLSVPTLNPINCSGSGSDGPAAVTPADRSSATATHTPIRLVKSFEARSTDGYYRFERHGAHGRDTIRHADGPGPIANHSGGWRLDSGHAGNHLAWTGRCA